MKVVKTKVIINGGNMEVVSKTISKSEGVKRKSNFKTESKVNFPPRGVREVRDDLIKKFDAKNLYISIFDVNHLVKEILDGKISKEEIKIKISGLEIKILRRGISKELKIEIRRKTTFILLDEKAQARNEK